MEHLIGNFWIHDSGDGAVSLYERIGRNYRPVRAESEPLPDRIPFEAQQVIKQRLADAAELINRRTPREVRIARLTEVLKLFPKFQSLSEEEQDDFLDKLSEGIPESFEIPKPQLQGLPAKLTPEQECELANKVKREEIDRLAFAQTQNLRLAEESAAKDAEIAALRAQLAGKQESNGPTQ